MIQRSLGEEFSLIASVSLQATHLVIFAHNKLIPFISKVYTDTIATGWGNMMGNKGAVKIMFSIATKRFVFINTHMHSGQSKVDKRNNDIEQIFG